MTRVEKLQRDTPMFEQFLANRYCVRPHGTGNVTTRAKRGWIIHDPCGPYWHPTPTRKAYTEKFLNCCQFLREGFAKPGGVL